MTYSVLPPITLQEIASDFTQTNTSHPHSCEDLGVNLIPINIQCKNFPRLSGNTGASGIGFLESNNPNFDKIFVPRHIQPPHDPMNCNATILSDIILNYDVTFSNGSQIIDMANLSTENKMSFMCKKRDPMVTPDGCLAD